MVQSSELSPRVEPGAGQFRFRHPWHHRLLEGFIFLLATTAVLAIALIFIFIGKEALPLLYSDEILAEVSLAKMWFAQQWPGYDAAEHIWQPVSEVPKYGIWPLVSGTLKVTVVAVLVAAPLGIGAAIYVSQYASPRMRELIKPVIELLAAFPSVVLGFFALMVMATWVQDLFALDSRLSALLAALGMSFALVPIIFTMSEEALRAVPRTYVEASIALGARRWQTILFVILPAAAPGIGAAIALGFGRAIGETMVVLMASGNAAIHSLSLGDSVRTLPATVAAELAEVVFGGPHYTVLFFIGVLLFLVTLVVNLVGGAAIERMKARHGGGA